MLNFILKKFQFENWSPRSKKYTRGKSLTIPALTLQNIPPRLSELWEAGGAAALQNGNLPKKHAHAYALVHAHTHAHAHFVILTHPACIQNFLTDRQLVNFSTFESRIDLIYMKEGNVCFFLMCNVLF